MKPHQIIKTRKNKKNHTKESKQEKIKKPHQRIKTRKNKKTTQKN